MAETSEGTVCPIQTFVFLDIETTGLPDYNFGKANITELAMWTLSREDLRKSTETPRLLGKWTTVFNPGMMIHPESSRITGKCNYVLHLNHIKLFLTLRYHKSRLLRVLYSAGQICQRLSGKRVIVCNVICPRHSMQSNHFYNIELSSEFLSFGLV